VTDDGADRTLDLWLSVADDSHRRLVAEVDALTPEQVAGPSFASDWSIAQVLSHLGSGAEIFTNFVQAGLEDEPAPGADDFKPVWERWDAKPPGDQAVDAIAADQRFLQLLHDLDEEQRRDWTMAMFGSDLTLADLIRLRLGEHAVHSWDIAVMSDAAAVIAPDAAALLIDEMPSLVERIGALVDQDLRVRITTRDPARRFLLVADSEGTALEVVADGTEGDGAGRGASVDEGVLELPAEALIRLFYGRLDPAHTPSYSSSGVDLDILRRMFPGI